MQKPHLCLSSSYSAHVPVLKNGHQNPILLSACDRAYSRRLQLYMCSEQKGPRRRPQKRVVVTFFRCPLLFGPDSHVVQVEVQVGKTMRKALGKTNVLLAKSGKYSKPVTDTKMWHICVSDSSIRNAGPTCTIQLLICGLSMMAVL